MEAARGQDRFPPHRAVLAGVALLALVVALLGASPDPIAHTGHREVDGRAADPGEEYAGLFFLYEDIQEEVNRDRFYRKAADGFQEHLERYPEGETAGPARFHLAECRWFLRETEAAVRLWEEVTEASDRRIAARAHIRLGDLLYGQEEYEEALEHYRKGASDIPDSNESLRCRLHVGICLYLLGRRDEAKRALQEFVKKAPEGLLRATGEDYLDRLAEASLGGGAKEAIGRYQEDYKEYRKCRDKERKQLLGEVIRDNLEGWDGIDHPEILVTLLKMVTSKNNLFRSEAVLELVQIGSEASLAPLPGKLTNRNEPLRDPILRALVAEKVFIDDSIVEAIFEDGTDQTSLRIAAADYIAMRDSGDAVKKLYGEISISYKRKVRPRERNLNEGLRKAITRMRSIEAGRVLAGIAGDRSQPPLCRQFAVEALGRMGHAETVRDLIPLLKEKRIELVTLAAEALGRSGGPQAAEALLKRLRRKPAEPRLLTSLLRGLDRLDVPEKEERLTLFFSKSKQMEVRILAHSILRQMGGKATRARMLDALSDRVWQVRWHAIRAVGQGAPSKESVSALMARLPKEEGRLKYEVLKYLHRMTAVNLGLDPKKWAEWWKEARDDYDPGSVKRAPIALGPRADETLTEADAVHRYFGIKVLSRNAIFILDVSGSMVMIITVPPLGGESTRPRTDTKLNIAKQELIKVLKTFERRTAFNIMWFQTNYSALWKRMQPSRPESIAEAIKAVKNLQAGGATNIYDPLASAFTDPRVDTIYLLSDGEANAGAFIYPEDILREVAALNHSRMVTIHTIFLGGTSSFMERLARQNGGRYVPVAK